MLARLSRHLNLQPTIASRTLRSATSSSCPLKVLIIDGYAPEGRAELEAGGASTAGKLYVDLLNKSAPAGVKVASDIVFPADSDFETPDLSQVGNQDRLFAFYNEALYLKMKLMYFDSTMQ